MLNTAVGTVGDAVVGIGLCFASDLPSFPDRDIGSFGRFDHQGAFGPDRANLVNLVFLDIYFSS